MESKDRVEEALATFAQGFNCSQATLVALAPEAGLDRETALRVAGAFGAGFGRQGEACGAVAGALMAIGLKYAMVRPEEPEAKERTYQVAGEFIRRFMARHGALTCRELLGCDPSTPEGLARMKEKNFHATVCPRFVKAAVELASDVL